jgi:Arc/MetJ-type ribon-helix-helix transcriptional regulator
MKSVRLDAALETKLRAAARMEGVSESELIRQAIGQRCDTILANRADLRLADVIGIVHGGGGRARDASRKFAELLRERHEAEVAEHAARQGVGT